MRPPRGRRDGPRRARQAARVAFFACPPRADDRREIGMDGATFDRLSRTLGTAGSRRGALAALAGGVAAFAGRAAAGADGVEVEGDKCEGKPCNKNKNCGKGLICNNKGKCEYKNGNKGQNGDTCCKDSECKSGNCKKNICKK
jgi:hypothetical protein